MRLGAVTTVNVLEAPVAAIQDSSDDIARRVCSALLCCIVGSDIPFVLKQ